MVANRPPVHDPLDALSPSARALVLDILGIFVADALEAVAAGEGGAATRGPRAAPAWHGQASDENDSTETG